MSRRHTHPVYVGENNAPEPPEVPIPIAQNQPQPIEVAHVNLANEQELQLAPVERIDDVVGNEEIDELMPGDQIDVACEVEVANQIDPNVQMALDFQMAQDLHLAFTLEMEDFVAIQEKPPRKVRRPRTKRSTARLNYFKCSGCRRNIQADDLPECEEIDFICADCTSHY